MEGVLEPSEPDIAHVGVRGHGNTRIVQPGLVLQWQHTPIHNATAPAWSALVLIAPFPGAVAVRWVSADQLIPIRDPTPQP